MSEIPVLSELAGLRLDLLGRLLLAALLGGVIGAEREWNGKPAGFRTNLLICVGAALLTDLSITIAAAAGEGTPADPGRIAAQIVSGVGFLGAGTIIQMRGSVVGLTTAATLWVVAAIGIAVGAHAYVEAIGATLLVIVALLILGRVEPWAGSHEEHNVRITVDPSTPDWAEPIETRLGQRLRWEVVAVEKLGEDRVVATYHVSGRSRHWPGLVSDLVDAPGVQSVIRE